MFEDCFEALSRQTFEFHLEITKNYRIKPFIKQSMISEKIGLAFDLVKIDTLF